MNYEKKTNVVYFKIVLIGITSNTVQFFCVWISGKYKGT